MSVRAGRVGASRFQITRAPADGKLVRTTFQRYDTLMVMAETKICWIVEYLGCALIASNPVPFFSIW
jgi:hypothetical protein